MKMIISRNSPGVQWLGLFAVTAKSSELGQGTRISQARRSNLPHPPKKIISKLNFRAVNFFFFLSHGQNLSLKALYHVVSPPGQAG